MKRGFREAFARGGLPGNGPPINRETDERLRLAIRALTELLDEKPSAFARWYEKNYPGFPTVVRARLSPPADRGRILTAAIAYLGRYGTNAAPASRALGAICEDTELNLIGVRFIALRTLGVIGPGAVDAIPSLLRSAERNSGMGVSSLADVLAQIDPSGERSDRAWRELRRQAKNAIWTSNLIATSVGSLRTNAQVQPGSGMNWRGETWGTICFLRFIRSEAPRTIPGLRACLFDSTPRIRAKAAETLGKIDPFAAETVPDLKRLFDDEWLMVRDAATNAIQLIERR
jgi:hypothetical protein